MAMDEKKPEVNIHRVINLKRQFQDEIKEKKKMLKQSLIQTLETEKEKFFKSSDKQRDRFKNEELQSKNKKRKEKWIEKGHHDAEQDAQAQEDEDLEAANKRKRMSLYGIK